MILYCTECNKEMSSKATSCPHCGAPNELWAVCNMSQEEYTNHVVNEVIREFHKDGIIYPTF